MQNMQEILMMTPCNHTPPSIDVATEYMYIFVRLSMFTIQLVSRVLKYMLFDYSRPIL